MLTARLKIGSGSIADTQDYGLVYLSSDNIFGPPTKGFDTTSYPEQEGENILPKTVDAPFDYKVRFYVKAEGALENANQKIAAFNAMLYTQESGSGSGSGSGTDTKTFKQVHFYNDYKKVLIVGYPQPISEAEDFWRDSKGKTHDVVVVEWTIRVTKPSLCDFNLSSGSGSGSGS